MEKMIDLSDEEPIVLMHLVRHFYGRSYDPKLREDTGIWNVFRERAIWETHFTVNALVYVAAEKYGISPLKATARKAFAVELPGPDLFRKSRQGELQALIEDLIEVIHFIWANTVRSNDELRRTVIAGLTGDQGRLVSRILDRADFLELIKEYPELAVEIMRRALPPT